MKEISFFDMARSHFRNALEEVDQKRGWYFALGAFLIFLGFTACAMAVTATMLSVVALGWILLAAGAGLAVLSFLTGKWSGFLLSVAAAALSVIAGITIISYPVSGAVGITLMVGTILIAAGIYRSIASTTMQFPGWSWSLASGIASIAVGALLLKNWQSTSLWFLGVFVGIDLIVHGFSWIMFSLMVHRLAGELDISETNRRAA